MNKWNILWIILSIIGGISLGILIMYAAIVEFFKELFKR